MSKFLFARGLYVFAFSDPIDRGKALEIIMHKGIRKIYPASMSLRERDLRSKLGRLIGGHAMVRGTVSVKGRSCGKSGCKCMRGEKHESMYIAFSESGKTHHLYVPKDRQDDVSGWVRDYQEAQELLEELSKIYVEKMRSTE